MDMGVASPYSPPRAELDGPELAEGVAWRIEGRTLYARSGTKLPDVCIFTGEPTRPDQRVEQDLSWTPRWYGVAWIIATVPAALAYGYFRRSGALDFGLGDAGQKRYRRGRLFNLGIAILCLALLVLSVATGEPFAAVSVIVATVVALAIVAARSRLFRVAGIDRRCMRIELTLPAAQALARLVP
jgi:hypothetical protein